MDIENLKRASEIKAQIEVLQEASDNLAFGYARIFVSRDWSCDEKACACITDKSILKDIRHLIDEHIEALLEEAKTL